MKKTRLQLFAKPPVPGQVKTRLIPDIGADKAAAVYRHCLQANIELAKNSPFDFQIWLTEASDDALFDGVPVRYQQGRDLGERMLYALQNALREDFRKVILIGSDCLDLSSGLLERVCQKLQQHELVLIPALDGGYVLIAVCAQVHPDLFEDIEWSSEQVLKQTLERAMRRGIDTLIMNPLRDIDRVEDLQHYAQLTQLLS